MYGYRYKPAGTVFELPGRDLDTAAAEVIARRQVQSRNQNTPTAELVEQVGGGWWVVPLPGGDGVQ